MTTLNLRDRFPPMQAQRGLLSCVPIAFCDALWWEVQRERFPGAQKWFTPSVQFVYYNARKLEGEENVNAPVPPSSVMKALEKWGVCDTELWPDETGLYRTRPEAEAFEQALSLNGWRFEEVPQTLAAIRGCLESETPFFFCIRFCNSNSWSFEGGETSETGLLALPNADETPFRNHAMLAVGLDEDKQLVHARNSYGPEWGEQGHALVPLAYLLNTEMSYAFWKLVPPADAG